MLAYAVVVESEPNTGTKFNVRAVTVTAKGTQGRDGLTWHGLLFNYRDVDRYKLCYASITPSGALRFETCVRSSLSVLQKDLGCRIEPVSEPSKRLSVNDWQEIDDILQGALARVDWSIGDTAEEWAAQAIRDVLHRYSGRQHKVWLQNPFVNDPFSGYKSAKGERSGTSLSSMGSFGTFDTRL